MARNNYTPEQRAAWQAERLAGERARGVHSNKINQLPRYDSRTMNPFGPKGSLAKAINQPITAAVKAKMNELDHIIAAKMKKGQTIHSNVPSTCLASLGWKADPDGDGTEGTATAEFFRGGAVVYDYPMTKDDFLDWVESDSIGKYGNAFVFD